MTSDGSTSADPVFTWGMAEELAVAHLRRLGFADARRTPPGADGGIDAQGTGVVAQVKFHAQPVGAPDVQRLRGTAHGLAHAVFYALSGYTAAAVTYAGRADVALFTFTTENVVTPVNKTADVLVRASGSRTPTQELARFLGEGLRTLRQMPQSSKAVEVLKRTVEVDALPAEQRARAIAAFDELVRFATEWPAFEAQFWIPFANASQALVAATRPDGGRPTARALEVALLDAIAVRDLGRRQREHQVELLIQFADATGLDRSALIDPTPEDEPDD